MRIIWVIGIQLIWVSVGWSTDWPQWRGPKGDGRGPTGPYPVQWSPTKHVKWKTAVPGAGNSSPIIWKDKVFLTASTGLDHRTLHLLCYDRSRGRLLWESRFFASPAPSPFAGFPPERGHAAPTPATDGDIVVGLFGSGDLVAVDLDGRLRWFRALAAEYGPFRNEYGIGASPILHQGTVYVQIDHDTESYLLAVDAKTGSTKWRSQRRTKDNWATPLIAQVGNRHVLIALGTHTCIAYDVENGSEVWSLNGFERLCSVTPIADRGILYATSGPRGEVMAVDLVSARKGQSPTILWRSKKIGPFIPSPILVGEYLYVLDDGGFITCLEAKSGQERWKERLGSRGRASPVAAGDIIYFTGLDGTTLVLRADGRFEPVAKNKMGEDVAASPALADGDILIRSEKHLWCISIR